MCVLLVMCNIIINDIKYNINGNEILMWNKW